MSDPKQPKRSTEDILREMESVADSPAPAKEKPSGGGTLRSFLDFFVKVVPDEDEPVAMPTDTTPRREPSLPPTATPTRVSDLVKNEPAPTFATAPVDEADLSQKPFDEIYAEAGIGETTCSVNELETLLNNPTIVNQPMSVKIVAVNLALSAKGVTIEAPVSDAVRRDRALDAYQKMLVERSRAIEQENMARIQGITKEIEEYLKAKQAEVDVLRGEIAEAGRQSLDFSARREAEERRLASLVSPFLEGKPNPVTVQSMEEIAPKS
jgi:hypothetical protein